MTAAARSSPHGGHVDACDGCLRRTDLLAAVAARLDIEWRRRRGPQGVLALDDEALLSLDSGGGAIDRYRTFAAPRARAAIRAAGLGAVCRCSTHYPDRLRQLDDPPAVVHVAGALDPLYDPEGVALVGARRATPYGLEVARSLGRGLAAAGVPVISGLALGVDSAAHAGALERPARPVAVLAGAAERPYPARMRALHARIVATGCAISEMPPGFGGHRWCFVARNRIIAALAAVTVVIEAADRSGSLTTADFAAQLGRTVAAVPGPVTSPLSSGTNTLLASGAALITDAGDIVEHLSIGGVATDPRDVETSSIDISREAACVLEAIEGGCDTPAELAEREDPRAVLVALTELELHGLVRRRLGGRYARIA